MVNLEPLPRFIIKDDKLVPTNNISGKTIKVRESKLHLSRKEISEEEMLLQQETGDPGFYGDKTFYFIIREGKQYFGKQYLGSSESLIFMIQNAMKLYNLRFVLGNEEILLYE